MYIYSHGAVLVSVGGAARSCGTSHKEAELPTWRWSMVKLTTSPSIHPKHRRNYIILPAKYNILHIFTINLLYLEKYSFLAVWEWRLADVHALLPTSWSLSALVIALRFCWRNDLQISANPRQLCNVLCIGRLPRYDTTSLRNSAAGNKFQPHIACLISPLDVPPRCSQDFSTSRHRLRTTVGRKKIGTDSKTVAPINRGNMSIPGEECECFRDLLCFGPNAPNWYRNSMKF